MPPVGWTCCACGADRFKFGLFFSLIYLLLMMCPRDEDPHTEPEPLPMDGVLDLHMFPPREVKELVPVWLDECRRLGLREVRIIHGKGIGVLREIVYGILDKDEGVESYRHPSDRGSWGATVVLLRPAGEMDEDDGS